MKISGITLALGSLQITHAEFIARLSRPTSCPSCVFFLYGRARICHSVWIARGKRAIFVDKHFEFRRQDHRQNRRMNDGSLARLGFRGSFFISFPFSFFVFFLFFFVLFFINLGEDRIAGATDIVPSFDRKIIVHWRSGIYLVYIRSPRSLSGSLERIEMRARVCRIKDSREERRNVSTRIIGV